MSSVDDVLVKAEKWLEDKAKDFKTGVCFGRNFSIPDGKPIAQPHEACHAWVTYAYSEVCFGLGGRWISDFDIPYVGDAENFLCATAHPQDFGRFSCSARDADAVVKFIKEDTPFSQFVLNKNTDKGLVLLCGPDGLKLAQAMWLLKVHRLITEGGYAATTFRVLYEGGIDGMVALYVASAIRSYDGAVFTYTGTDGHSTVIGLQQDQLRNTTDPVGLFNREVNKDANTTSVVFGECKKGSIKVNVKSFCNPRKKSDGWGGFISAQGADIPTLIGNVREWEEKLRSLSDPAPTKKPDSSTVYLDIDL